MRVQFTNIFFIRFQIYELHVGWYTEKDPLQSSGSFLILISILKPGVSPAKTALGGLAHPVAAGVVVGGGKAAVVALAYPMPLGIVVVASGGAVPAGTHLVPLGVVMGGAERSGIAGSYLVALLVVVDGAAKEAGTAGDLLFHVDSPLCDPVFLSGFIVAQDGTRKHGRSSKIARSISA